MKKPVIYVSLLLALALLSGRRSVAETGYSTVVTNDRPFLYWNFDEAMGDALQKVPIESGEPEPGSNDLIPFGATRVSHSAIASGLNLGSAAALDGASYFMAESLAAHTNVIAAPYAVEFWMQVQGATDGQRNDYLLNLGAGGGNAPAVLYDYVGSEQERLGIELFAGGRTGAGPQIAEEAWHHVLLVYYGDGTTGVADRVDLYLDGVNAAAHIRNTFASSLNLASRLVVGTSAPQFAAGDGFEGRIDELAIYDLTSLETEAAVTSKADALAAGHFSGATATEPSYSQLVLSDGPALYWSFDEAEGPARQLAPVTPGGGSDGSNDLVPTGDLIRYRHEDVGSGLNLGGLMDFDGTGMMRAELLNLGVKSVPAPWAIEFWMQALGADDGYRNDYLLSMGLSGGNEPAVIFDYIGSEEDNVLELFQLGGRSGSGPVVGDGQWHHVFIVSYGNGITGVADRLEMYLDGVAQGSNIRNTFTAALNLGNQFIVGNSPAPADGFEGRMDEVAIYRFTDITTEAALESKVTAMAARRVEVAQATTGSYTETILADHPLLYYNFEEAEGNAIQRAPVNTTPDPTPKNNLTPVGAERVSHASLGSGLDLGNAADFDGATYFFAERLSTTKTVLAAPWMIEFWFQVQGANEGLRNDYLMNFGPGGGNQPAVLYDYIGGAQAEDGLELFAGGRTGAGPVISDQEWHYALLVYYGDGNVGVADQVDVYLDGVLTAADIRNTFAASLNVDSRLVVGTSAPAFAAGDGFEGRIDEVAVYDLSEWTTAEAVSARAADIAARHFAAARATAEGVLAIRSTGDQIVISWPASVPDLVLESSPALISPEWQEVTETPVSVGDQRQVTIPAENDVRFFRLRSGD